MKKFLVFIALALMPFAASAQAQIDTKKVKISDFTQKVTKVVLTGRALYDGVLQDEVTARWRVSPYEFCSLEEFNSLKGNENYYFLITTYGQFKKETEPSLQFLTLVKGGKKASKGIDAGDEVEIDFNTGIITNVTKGTTFQGQAFPEFMQKIIAAEGLINYINSSK